MEMFMGKGKDVSVCAAAATYLACPSPGMAHRAFHAGVKDHSGSRWQRLQFEFN